MRGCVMSGQVFAKRAIDRTEGFDRKRTIPAAEDVRRLSSPLVFRKSRKAHRCGGGDLRISAIANGKGDGVEWQISFRFSHEVSQVLGLTRGDRVVVSTEDGVVWKCAINASEDGFALTQQKGCHSKTLYMRAPVDCETIKLLGIERSETHIPALTCDLQSREGQDVTFVTTGIS